MRFVLDTNVVSAMRIRGRNPAVERWAASVRVSDQFVTATTIAEIERGVAKMERQDAAQGVILRRWFDERVLPAFADRVLPFDLSSARVLAGFRVPERAPLDDTLIAATSHARGMVIVTRNIERFAPLGVPTLNPWEPLNSE